MQNVYNGSGSCHIPEDGGKEDVVSPVQGITQRGLGNGDTVVYADGSSTVDAVAAATAADVAVVFAGQEDSDSADRANLQNTYTVCQFTRPNPKASASATAGTTPGGSRRCSFGFGLSVHDVRVQRSGCAKAAANGTVTLGFTLKNTGSRLARRSHRCTSPTGRRGRAAEAAEWLPEGAPAARRVAGRHHVLDRAFAVWDTAKHAWVVPDGKYTLLAGSSSRDIRLQAAISVPKRVLGP